MRVLPLLWLSGAVGAALWEVVNPVIGVLGFVAVWAIAFVFALRANRL
jgi:hypothetical protein